MLLAFYHNDLLDLLKLSFTFSVPIVTAPFTLAIFGFRGTSRTALVGMATGALAIWAWNQWVKPETGMDGAFFCMIANGLAMMTAHYLLPQPVDAGWVELDDDFKQIQQANARKKARRKEQHKEVTYMLIAVGIFAIVMSIWGFVYGRDQIHWPILQLLVGACLLGYAKKGSNRSNTEIVLKINSVSSAKGRNGFLPSASTA